MDGSLFHTWPEQPDIDKSRPMIIDSFAGGGGASTGIEMALGRAPDVAINHNPAALALHAANHPDTLHLINSIYAVDPGEVCQGQHVGLAWFSPDCKHFSKAKGGKPVEKGIRDLAWVVVHWAERVRPDVIMLENVEEFQHWGPLTPDHQPDPDRKGETFRAWVRQLKRLGYKVEWRELRACDYGAPTIRKRLFVIARRDGQPIVWPTPTHAAPDSDEVAEGFCEPWRTAAECIDWSLPCPSIFDTAEQIKKKHGLRAIRPLARNTMDRVARGMKRYVLDAQRPFIVNLTHGARLEDAAAPFRTITGANRGEKAITTPLIATMRNSGKPWQGVDQPTHTITAGGAGLTLIAPSLTRFNGGATGQDLRAPMATVTANSFIKRPGGAAPLGIVAPSLMSMKGTQRRACPIDTPHPTVLAGGGHSALLAPVLTYAQQGGGNRAIDTPHHTICASKKDQNMVIAPTLIQSGYGERAGQAPRALDLGKPLGTVVAGGIKHAAAAAFLAQQNGGPRMTTHTGHDLRAPISTIAATGSHQTPVAAFFAKYYGTGDGASHDEPTHTITTKDRFAHTQAELAAPPFGPEFECRARKVAEFLRAHGAWDGGEFVTLTIDGTEYVIVDIGLRMLTPRELFNAQGFPKDYVIDGVWQDHKGEWSFKTFPKNVQVSCCGNSVAPAMAEALARANCAHLMQKGRNHAL